VSQQDSRSEGLASEESLKRVVDHYERLLKRHGATARGMDWKDEASQQLRFDALCEGFELSGSSVHDVGSGAGHFCDYLLEREIDVRYSGSDRSEKMIETARRRHPGVSFERRDALDASHSERYDFVFCSGLFNVKLDCPDPAWQDFVESTVIRMFEMCKVAISFNIMSDRVDYRAEELYYSNPNAMSEFCRNNLSRHVVIRDDYPLYEYTVHVRR
jgi:SAM-dependent methyltransferase